MVGNLSIRSKLIPLLAVPVASSLLLGVAGVAGGFGERARAAEEARVAVVAAQAVAAAHELQEERVRAVAWLAGRSHANLAELAELAARRRRVDRAVAAYRAGGGHDALVDALIGAARGLVAHLDAPEPSRTARLLLAVAAAKEATVRSALSWPGLSPPNPGRRTTRCCGSGWWRGRRWPVGS